jgi:hypothetical protein
LPPEQCCRIRIYRANVPLCIYNFSFVKRPETNPVISLKSLPTQKSTPIRFSDACYHFRWALLWTNRRTETLCDYG